MVTAVREFSLEHHLLDRLQHSGTDRENLADLVSIIVSLKNKYGMRPFTVAASIGPVPTSLTVHYMLQSTMLNKPMNLLLDIPRLHETVHPHGYPRPTQFELGLTSAVEARLRSAACVTLPFFAVQEPIVYLRKLVLFAFLCFVSCQILYAQTKTVAERLGYPADTKLLIIHADDLAIAHSEDAASFEALDKNSVTSASVIVPGPWLTEVAAYAKAHPDADLGLHLALTSEWKTFRWGSAESKDKVPTLLDPTGALWPLTENVAKNAKPQEVEREYRAQVERAMAAGIRPTHLDTHMGSALATPEILAVYVKIAHEFHLPILAPRIPGDPLKLSALLSEKDVMVDSVVIANPSIQADKWKEFYLDAIKNMKPGLTEIIVHLGHDDAELQAVMVDHPDYGSAWRQRDFDVVSSPEIKKALQDNHIVLIKWKDLQKIIQ